MSGQLHAGLLQPLAAALRLIDEFEQPLDLVGGGRTAVRFVGEAREDFTGLFAFRLVGTAQHDTCVRFGPCVHRPLRGTSDSTNSRRLSPSLPSLSSAFAAMMADR